MELRSARSEGNRGTGTGHGVLRWPPAPVPTHCDDLQGLVHTENSRLPGRRLGNIMHTRKEPHVAIPVRFTSYPLGVYLPIVEVVFVIRPSIVYKQG